VENHGGNISVHSDGLNQGAKFRVVFQADRSTTPPAESSAELSEMTDVSDDRQRKGVRVLLVEDNETIQLVMIRILTKMNHHVSRNLTEISQYNCTENLQKIQVISAATVASAISAGMQNDFDILICDIGLPDGTGFEVVKHLQREKSTKFHSIALSGYSLPEDVQASTDAGFEKHMVKPVNTVTLRDAIDELMEL
jgi:CheY-like chemotaxis protein